MLATKYPSKILYEPLLHLHLAVFIISFAPVLAKMASQFPFASTAFLFPYSLMVLIFAGYAVVWQRVLARVDLAVAYAARSMVVVYSLIWAVLIFRESISLNNILGSLLIVIGVVLAGSK
jgi:drug/metabolite transporter (DMT)-like permease